MSTRARSRWVVVWVVIGSMLCACTGGKSPKQATMEAPMVRYQSKDGTMIACERSGSGPPLVLVHGTTADHTRWAPVLPALSEHFTVYACDRRGRGESGDEAPYALQREAEDVAAVVDGIGGPVDVLGHSYGALCALESALLTSNVRRLVLYEPPAAIPRAPEGAIERLQTLLDAGDKEGVVTAFMQEFPRVPEHELARMKQLPVWQVRVAAAGTIPRELRVTDTYQLDPKRFVDVGHPVLFLLGGDSPEFFRTAEERLQEAMPDARMVVLPGQQHVAIDTAPELFAREVLTFLRE